ncbi:MAG: hypothetical protein DHS80DRAFT_25542 [Piptocephalis tieghemiana]|nr:MAG: hypothetical protein DHS80DRAFT_25542 [Piptocephalis tieghemiana]
MVVTEITTRDEFDRLTQDGDTVVLDLYNITGDNYMNAQFEGLSIKYPSIKFAKADLKQHPDVGGPVPDVTAVHTFQIFKDGVCKECYIDDVEPLDSTIANSYK